MSVMLPCSCLIVEPDDGHTSVGPCCMLQCISVRKSLHAFRTCLTIALGIMWFAPSNCDLSILVRLHAASSTLAQTEDSSTFRQPTRAASARQHARHEHVCLVPVGKYLLVPIVQRSLATHPEGFLLY